MSCRNAEDWQSPGLGNRLQIVQQFLALQAKMSPWAVCECMMLQHLFWGWGGGRSCKKSSKQDIPTKTKKWECSQTLCGRRQEDFLSMPLQNGMNAFYICTSCFRVDTALVCEFSGLMESCMCRRGGPLPLWRTKVKSPPNEKPPPPHIAWTAWHNYKFVDSKLQQSLCEWRM